MNIAEKVDFIYISWYNLNKLEHAILKNANREIKEHIHGQQTHQKTV